MGENVYQAYYHSKIATSKVLDNLYIFNKFNEYKYDQVCLNNFFKIIHKGQKLNIGIFIKRYLCSGKYISSGMNFSELKKYVGSKIFQTNEKAYLELVDESVKVISSYEGDFNKSGVELVLQCPIRFEAQSSANRRGFGKRGYDEGTYYGNVDKYLISAIFVSTKPINENSTLDKKYVSFNIIVR